MGWKCWNCGEEELDYMSDMSVCVNCGAGKDGSRNPEFEAEVAAVNKRAAELRGESPKKSSGESKCFVATAVYSSPLAPEVVILNRFRDDILLNSNFGKFFVALYYWLSPALASLIARSGFLRVLVRTVLLAPILSLLKHKKFRS